MEEKKESSFKSIKAAVEFAADKYTEKYGDKTLRKAPLPEKPKLERHFSIEEGPGGVLVTVSCDARLLAELGIPAITPGAGSLRFAHSND